MLMDSYLDFKDVLQSLDKFLEFEKAKVLKIYIVVELLFQGEWKLSQR